MENHWVLNQKTWDESFEERLERELKKERRRKLGEEIRLIPAVSRVLVEYERLYNKEKAGEMFEILVEQVVDFCELHKAREEKNEG